MESLKLKYGSWELNANDPAAANLFLALIAKIEELQNRLVVLESPMRNLKAAQVIMDSLGILKSTPEDLAILITRAMRADAIGNIDSYHNQCAYIKDLLNEGPIGPASRELLAKVKVKP